MAVDIRRMNFEELEELNRSGREWRERGKKPAQSQHGVAGDTSLEHVAETQEQRHVLAPEAIPRPVQLNLFGGEQP